MAGLGAYGVFPTTRKETDMPALSPPVTTEKEGMEMLES